MKDAKKWYRYTNKQVEKNTKEWLQVITNGKMGQTTRLFPRAYPIEPKTPI
jgi:hypothetical protein